MALELEFSKPVVVRGTITKRHIRKGEPRSTAYCPLGLSLREKGCTNVKISNDAVVFDHPSKGIKLISALPTELRDWIRTLDQGGEVQPIKYRLELQA